MGVGQSAKREGERAGRARESEIADEAEAASAT